MGIFSGLFKSRDKPVNRTPGSSFAFYMGGSSSGKIVNERSAMQKTESGRLPKKMMNQLISLSTIIITILIIFYG